MATIGADEEIAAELEASAERSELRGGHASAATAFERAARLSETESGAWQAARCRGPRTALAAGQLDRAGDLVRRALPTCQSCGTPPSAGPRADHRGFTGSLAEAVTTLLDGIAPSEDPSLSLEMLLEGFGLTVYLADYEKMHELCVRAAEFPPVTDTDRFIVTFSQVRPPSWMATTDARGAVGRRDRDRRRVSTMPAA